MQDKVNSRTRAARHRKSVNLSIDVDLLCEAKASGMNLSALLERALRAELRLRREAQWREDNRAAVASMNDYIDANGLPLGGYRTW